MKYKSQGKQLTFEAFRSSLDNLPKSNRWVRMGDELPWDEIERYYNSRLNNRYMGAGNKPARMVVGALIVKHKMNLSDEETILAIQENPYMQYMLGLSEYTEAPVFDPSLFVTIRKRLQINDLNGFTDALLKLSIRKADSSRNDKEDSGDNREDSGDSDTFIDSSGTLHKGSMKIDATCCDAEVRYPTDVDLLEDGSRVINRYIGKLCRKFQLPLPPTFGEQARKVYLGLVKLKKKSRSRIRKCKGLMLNYLENTQRHMLAHLSTCHVENEGEFLDMDYSTRQNLELTIPLHQTGKAITLWSFLDKCRSAMGSRLLRKWIEKPLVSQKKIEERYDRVQTLIDQFMNRQRLRDALSNIYDLERLIARCAMNTANPIDLSRLSRTLDEVPEILSCVAEPAFAAFENVDMLDELRMHIATNKAFI